MCDRTIIGSRLENKVLTYWTTLALHSRRLPRGLFFMKNNVNNPVILGTPHCKWTNYENSSDIPETQILQQNFIVVQRLWSYTVTDCDAHETHQHQDTNTLTYSSINWRKQKLFDIVCVGPSFVRSAHPQQSDGTATQSKASIIYNWKRLNFITTKNS
jgi:hypothetical protein